MDGKEKNSVAMTFLGMSDEELAGELLSKDLLYHKIPHDQVESYIKMALAYGSDLAQPYAGMDMIRVCRDKGIRVEYSDGEGGCCGIRLRAEIILGGNDRKIVIYRSSVAELRAICQMLPGKDEGLSDEKALQMMLAHEFFHFLEYESGTEICSRMPKVVCWRFGKWKKTAAILTLSELSAHRFSQCVSGLAHFPYMYDKFAALQTA